MTSKEKKTKKNFSSILHQKAGIPLPQLPLFKEEVARILFLGEGRKVAKKWNIFEEMKKDSNLKTFHFLQCRGLSFPFSFLEFPPSNRFWITPPPPFLPSGEFFLPLSA